MTDEFARATLYTVGAMLVLTSLLPLAFGGFAAWRSLGPVRTLRTSKRARRLVTVNAIFLYIAIAAVFVFPFPLEPEFAFRALATRLPFMVAQMVLAAMLVDEAYSLSRPQDTGNIADDIYGPEDDTGVQGWDDP